MSEFMSINYSRVVCNKCGSETTIEPGVPFKELNCTCNTENIMKEFVEITQFVKEDGIVVDLIGEFANGDVEIKYPDGSLSYRMSFNDFNTQFAEVNTDETTEETEDNKQEQESKTPFVTLSLDTLQGMTADEIKDAYNMDELRVLAKASKIRGASQMNEDKLVGKLLTKVE